MGLPVAIKKNVFILDLEINGIKTAGLEISRVIRKHDELASIIFITIHDGPQVIVESDLLIIDSVHNR